MDVEYNVREYVGVALDSKCLFVAVVVVVAVAVGEA